MNIRVTSDDKVVEELKYQHIRIEQEKEKRQGNEDLLKLMALQRQLAMRPAEKELKQLSKDNQCLKKIVSQLRAVCRGDGQDEQKVQAMRSILNNF